MQMGNESRKGTSTALAGCAEHWEPAWGACWGLADRTAARRVGHNGARRAGCIAWLWCDLCVSACSSFQKNCAPLLILARCSLCWSVLTRALWMPSVKMRPSEGSGAGWPGVFGGRHPCWASPERSSCSILDVCSCGWCPSCLAQLRS